MSIEIQTAKDKQFLVNLTIVFDKRAGSSTPVQVDVDFDKVLGQRRDARLIDPHSLLVKRRLRGRMRRYPVQFLEKLYYGNRGWVAWLVDEPQAGGEWLWNFRYVLRMGL